MSGTLTEDDLTTPISLLGMARRDDHVLKIVLTVMQFSYNSLVVVIKRQCSRDLS